jgi:predicted alpha/beta hydrolase
LAIYPGLKPIHADDLFQPNGSRASHFGFFRPGAESALWPSVLRWITGLS